MMKLMTKLKELVGKKIIGFGDHYSSVTIIAEDDAGDKHFLVLEPEDDGDDGVQSTDYWCLNQHQVEQQAKYWHPDHIDQETIDHYKEIDRLKNKEATKENEKRWKENRRKQWEDLNKEFGDN